MLPVPFRKTAEMAGLSAEQQPQRAVVVMAGLASGLSALVIMAAMFPVSAVRAAAVAGPTALV